MKILKKLKMWFNNRGKPIDPDNNSCDLDAMLSLQCPIVNPFYIIRITKTLRKVSELHTKNHQAGNYGYTSNLEALKLIQSQLTRDLRDFFNAHDLKIKVSIETYWKEIEKLEDDALYWNKHLEKI